MKKILIAILFVVSLPHTHAQIIDSFPWFKAELKIVSASQLRAPAGIKLGKNQIQTTSEFKFVRHSIFQDSLLWFVPADFNFNSSRFPVNTLSKSARTGKVYINAMKNTALYAITCPGGRVTMSRDGKTVMTSSGCSIQRADPNHLKAGSVLVVAPDYVKPGS